MTRRRKRRYHLADDNTAAIDPPQPRLAGRGGLMAKSEYHHLQDGEWFRPTMRNYMDQCCDCGLVHRTIFRIKDGCIEFQVFRDGPATGGARKNKGRK